MKRKVQVRIPGAEFLVVLVQFSAYFVGMEGMASFPLLWLFAANLTPNIMALGKAQNVSHSCSKLHKLAASSRGCSADVPGHRAVCLLPSLPQSPIAEMGWAGSSPCSARSSPARSQKHQATAAEQAPQPEMIISKRRGVF